MNTSLLINAIFLIAGSCIGGGMLALPVEMGFTGFVPSIVFLIGVWVYMLITGLFVAKAHCNMPGDGHFISMADYYLGYVGKYIVLILYLFIGYISLVAYASSGFALIQSYLTPFGLSVNYLYVIPILILALSSVLPFGGRIVGAINSYLVLGLIIAYAGVVFFGAFNINSAMLERGSFKGIERTLPLLLATFSYQMVVPSISSLLSKNMKQCTKAIIYGTLIPFVVYAVWLGLVFGIVPYDGALGLKEAYINGLPSTIPLKAFSQSTTLSILSELFAFFALLTSYLGIGLGLYDFLSDLLKIESKGFSKVFLYSLIVLPVSVITLLYPEIFILALDVSGGFGDAILSNLLPAIMVYQLIKGKSGLLNTSSKVLVSIISCISIYIVYVQYISLFCS